jgi:predicted Rossmann-fold nucleotide-binding protein
MLSGIEMDKGMSAEEQGTKSGESGVGTGEKVPASSAAADSNAAIPAATLPPNGAPPALAVAPLAYENPAFLNGPDGRLIRIVAEYVEPLARIRREHIQDTVVFFGSARFRGREEADHALELLDNTGSRQPAPCNEQPASVPDIVAGKATDLQRKRAVAAVAMARYYEDARRLAQMLTRWAAKIPSRRHRFVVTSGGGPGIMEAANRGAYEAGGKTIGMNIQLPFEQAPNPYITPALNFEFHYFFMRKLWFAYLAKALVVFPGGFVRSTKCSKFSPWPRLTNSPRRSRLWSTDRNIGKRSSISMRWSIPGQFRQKISSYSDMPIHPKMFLSCCATD